MKYPLVILSLFFCVTEFSPVSSTDSLGTDKNASQPLYLTPFIEEGNIRQARRTSKVKLPHFKGVKSFSGFLTVNKECESNLFFWFFPAQEDSRNAPVVLWLQGGPGASSFIGLFEEVGPILFDGSLVKRQYPWNVKNNLLFIDQPVGTGFSFTGNNCYATNETEVSKDVYSALMQFYQLFPYLRQNKFYIAGQSFGGHYVPVIGHAIHKNNPSAKFKINLSGLMIGNGMMDMMYQNDYSSYLYHLGLVDNKQRDKLQEIEEIMIEQIKSEDWKSGASSLRRHSFTYKRFLGNVSRFNFLKSSDIPNLWEGFITSQSVRKTIHVGNQPFNRHDIVVSSFLQPYTVQSVKPIVEELLEHYPVIFYNGQLDIACGYPMAINFFRNLQWRGTRDYQQAERQQWCVEGQLAGYFKSAHNLHEVLIRAAGHSVPTDQPLWAFELVNSVTSSPAHDPLQQLKKC